MRGGAGKEGIQGAWRDSHGAGGLLPLTLFERGHPGAAGKATGS